MRKELFVALAGVLILGAACQEGPSPGAPEANYDGERGVTPGLVLATPCSCQGEPATICGDNDDPPAGGGVSGDGVIEGTNGPDVILGTTIGEQIFAYAGDDIMCGGDGDDDLITGSGDDRARGNAGNDLLSGNGGNDILEGDPGIDNLQGDTGYDKCYGGPDPDVLNPTCEVAVQ